MASDKEKVRLNSCCLLWGQRGQRRLRSLNKSDETRKSRHLLRTLEFQFDPEKTVRDDNPHQNYHRNSKKCPFEASTLHSEKTIMEVCTNLVSGTSF